MLVPALSVRRGKVVVVRGLTYDPVEDAEGRPFGPAEFVDVFLRDFPAVLIFDIDSIERQEAQFSQIASLERAAPQIWWDAGARDHIDVVNILTGGADRAVISSRTFRNAREVRKAVELTENVTFELVTRGREVVAQSRQFQGRPPSEVAREVADAGVEEFLLIDAARPLGAPIDWGLAEAVATHAKALLVGGGVGVEQAKSAAAPPGVPLKGLVVDLISVMAPYL